MSDGHELLLRRPRHEDVDDIVAQCQDPEFQRWTSVPVPYHEADAHEFLARVAEGWSANTFLTFAIVHEGRFAGSIDLRLDGAGGADVGYGLARWARGNGVMTRALRLVLAWGFGELGLEVVHWKARVGNWPSRRVATRCGFRVKGTIRGLVEQRGKRHDGWSGSLCRGDPLVGEPDV
ncbi:MAG: GNAT family N-acetyltransferase [Mycobacterium sp.]|nr:GNAT family N-acetyltransferase [Mycobacterium sp.]